MSDIYEVRGVQHDGTPIRREYFAASVKDARKEALREDMKAVYEVAQLRENLWNYEYLGRDYRLKFLNALRFQVDAGVPIAHALQAIVDGETKALRRARLARTLIVIQRGGSLAEAIQAIGLFDEHVIALIRAGEQTGMKHGVRAAIQHEESKRESWRQVLGAVSVLSLELSTALSVPWSLHFYAVDFIRKSLMQTADKNKLDSFLNQLAIIEHTNLAWMVLTYGLSVLLGLWAAGFMMFEPVRNRSWPYLRHFPLLGRYMREASMASSTKIAAVMLRTGTRLGDTVLAIARTVSHGDVRRFWMAVSENLHNGRDAVRAFRHPMLNASETLAIAAHKDAHQLGDILEAISDEREYRRKALARKLMVMSIGLMVFYMAVSMGLALWAYWLYDKGATFNLESLQNLM
ncbi:type II secretion system F family protein [Paraburkholderia sp. EG287A]|uniref:type II secretion system F family protein n=1 Tax=Paraburkholderia sp. EG287A TaxID=3237012 RepID=UPI0034D22F58